MGKGSEICQLEANRNSPLLGIAYGYHSRTSYVRIAKSLNLWQKSVHKKTHENSVRTDPLPQGFHQPQH